MSEATILAPDGSVADVTHREITLDEAVLLRQYKKFLQRMGLREALYCQACWQGDRDDGCKAHVTPHEILIVCRCTVRSHVGMTM